MKKIGVLALFLSVTGYAAIQPVTDIYMDSLTIQRSSAEIPGSLAASTDDAIPDLTGQVSDDAPAVIEAARPKPIKVGRKARKK